MSANDEQDGYIVEQLVGLRQQATNIARQITDLLTLMAERESEVPERPERKTFGSGARKDIEKAR